MTRWTQRVGVAPYRPGDDRAKAGLRSSERQVRLLAHALATLIVDNPRLVRWVQCRD